MVQITGIRVIRTAVLAAVFVFSFLASLEFGQVAFARRPRVTGIDLFVKGGFLRGTLHVANVFTDEVQGTLESGLPAVIDLSLHLRETRGQKSHNLTRRITLTHDVWTNVYTLARGDTVLTFPSFDALRHSIERLESLPLARIARLDIDRQYVVELTVAVHPLAGSDDDLTGWVDEKVLGQSSRGWRERVLNVGDLVHQFFSHDSDSAFLSATYRTPPFVPATLRTHGDRTGTYSLALALVHTTSRRPYEPRAHHVVFQRHGSPARIFAGAQ